MQPLFERASLADRGDLLMPYRRAVFGRRHGDALHRRVTAGVLEEELVPDIEPGSDVPDALQQRQQSVFLGQIGHQISRRAKAQQRVVVVGQRDIAVLDIDVARHLDVGRLGRGHDAQRVTDRLAALNHLGEEVGGLRLVALEDRLGQQVEALVGADLGSVEQHYCSPRRRGVSSCKRNAALT